MTAKYDSVSEIPALKRLKCGIYYVWFVVKISNENPLNVMAPVMDTNE